MPVTAWPGRLKRAPGGRRRRAGGRWAQTTHSGGGSRERRGAAAGGRGGAGPSRSSSANSGRSRPGGQGRGWSAGRPQDRLLLGRRQPARLPVRSRGAVGQPTPRTPLVRARREIAVPPAVGCGRRDIEGGSCRPQCHPRLDRLHQRQPSRWSESGVTVNLHPGPPSLGRQNRKRLGGLGWPLSCSQRVWAGQLVPEIGADFGGGWKALQRSKLPTCRAFRRWS